MSNENSVIIETHEPEIKDLLREVSTAYSESVIRLDALGSRRIFVSGTGCVSLRSELEERFIEKKTTYRMRRTPKLRSLCVVKNLDTSTYTSLATLRDDSE